MPITRKPVDADVTGKRARAATDPNGPTGRLATWLANTTLDDIPTTVRERAKHLLLDGVACALVGAQLPVSAITAGPLHQRESGEHQQAAIVWMLEVSEKSKKRRTLNPNF